MKRILSAICILSGFWAGAREYNQTFYDLLQSKDYVQAETLLTEWEKVQPDDAEIFHARFNLYLNKARNSILVFEYDSDSPHSGLVLEDSLNQTVGELYESITWNDSLVSKAFNAIDQGIGSHPDRLDFWFGKATLCKYIEDWETLSKTAIETLERSQANGCKWLWTDNMVLEDGTGLGAMLDGIHDYELELLDTPFAETLLDIHILYYPNDHVALTNKGLIEYNKGNYDKAIEYTDKAHQIAPEDNLVTCNLAHLHKITGNIDLSVKLYRSVVENPDAEPEWIEEAEYCLKRAYTKDKAINKN